MTLYVANIYAAADAIIQSTVIIIIFIILALALQQKLISLPNPVFGFRPLFFFIIVIIVVVVVVVKEMSSA